MKLFRTSCDILFSTVFRIRPNQHISRKLVMSQSNILCKTLYMYLVIKMESHIVKTNGSSQHIDAAILTNGLSTPTER